MSGSHSDEVDQFLQKIRSLSDQRDQQDAERVKKLEEELIQGRSERLARRAERARSLSPDKPSTPLSPRSNVATPRSVQEKAEGTPTPAMDPSSQKAARNDSIQSLTSTPAQVLEDEEPKKPAPSAAALGRSGTLSWNRRPQSGNVRRPLSMVSSLTDRAPTLSPHDPPEPPSPERAPSRTQIAQSLGAKDPSWFKQTPDRGIGSAAFRKSQDEPESSFVSGRRQLPGLSRESTAEPELASPPPDSDRSSSSARYSGSMDNRSSRTSESTADIEPTSRLKSPIPTLDSQRFEPPSEQGSFLDGGGRRGSVASSAIPPAHGRASPERTDRPVSPTKGMGGFVQSAMLKRNDSVSKRWSAQAPQGLTRQNSTISNRGSAYGSITKPESKPSSLSRDNSLEPTSRPGSSSSNLTITRDALDSTPKPEFARPAVPHHTRTKSANLIQSDGKTQQDDISPPSPSKRWSPTKSSWLESALSKPESPKPVLPPPQQPAWMAEINKAKQQRGSVDLSKDVASVPDLPTSGRSSPIKDIQLRPVGLRRAASTKKEDPVGIFDITTPAQTSTKPKPVLSPKPAFIAENKPQVAEKPLEKSKAAADEVVESKSPPVAPGSKPSSIAARFPQDSSLPSPGEKPKPEAPVKKDFRAHLKSRQNESDSRGANEVSELQSVFGKLKRTETTKYVAPDTLKDNILRGKQGLAVTGGPKPTVRRDEFKESLIRKKSAMLAKAQETGSAAHIKPDTPPKEPETPEALAKRKNLGRTDTVASSPAPAEKAAVPEAISQSQRLRPSKSFIAARTDEVTASRTSAEPPKSSKLADRFNPALANMLARGPPPASNNPSASSNPSSSSNTSTAPAIHDKQAPAPELTHMTKGRARGPKRRAPGANANAGKAEDISRAPAENSAAMSVAPVPLVKPEHILSSSEPSDANSKSEEARAPQTPAAEPVKVKPVAPLKSPILSRSLERPESPPVAIKPRPLSVGRKASTDVNVTPKRSPLADIPNVFKGPPTSPPLPSPSDRNMTLRGASRPLPTPPATLSAKPAKEVSSPIADDVATSKEPPHAKANVVKGVTALWERQSTALSSTAGKSKSPIQLPTRADEEAAMEFAGLNRSVEASVSTPPTPSNPSPKLTGLSFSSLGSLGGLLPARSRASTPTKSVSSNPFATSPSASSERRQSEPVKTSPIPARSRGMFDEFFDEQPVTTGELPEHIDVMQILKTTPFDLGPNGQIKTLHREVREVTEYGTAVSVPKHEDNVLYQDLMYLCTHIFQDAKGTKHTEVYFWAGNSVTEPILEDVRPFARSFTKQVQGKLVELQQGKETPNFFHALGGIVITRRTRPAPKEYVLCGRRHMGQLAFDEVDFSLKSLCSAFPYIISTNAGKTYLWKGRGCSAEELSGARLMGMDPTAASEPIELDEGSEISEFFDAFPPLDGQDPAIPRSADYWRYKATSDRYRARLFKVEQQQPSGWGSLQVSSYLPSLLRRPSWGSISGDSPGERQHTPGTPKAPPGTTVKLLEMMPFCQRDLEPENIYVLDAFFEMYIIVGALSRTQGTAFATALMFAQEYSFLAVSEEDRPFVPITTVVLEGTPRDMKAVFRFWDDAMIPAAGLMRGKLGRGKSLRLVGLEKALEATRG